jgi:hypothetical protein
MADNPKIVQWTRNQRVGKGDLNAVSTLLSDADRMLARIIGCPNYDESASSLARGCVLRTANVTFDAVAGTCTIGAGLRVLLAAEVGSPGPYGDVVELEASQTVTDGCPTVGIPYVLLMALPGALTDTDLASRVVYDSTSTSKEKLQTLATRKSRGMTIVAVDSSDTATIEANEALGYERVAILAYNSGSPALSSWYTLFPRPSNLVRYPDGILESVIQTLVALASEIAIVKGTLWDSNLVHSDAALDLNYLRVAAIKAIVENVTTGNVALGGRVTTLEALRPCRAACVLRFNGGTDDPDVDGFSTTPFNISGAVRESAGLYLVSKTAITSGQFYSATWRAMNSVMLKWWRVRVLWASSSTFYVETQALTDGISGEWAVADPDDGDALFVEEF